MPITLSQRLAIAVGIVASICALGILLQDAFRTGVFTLEHVLIPGTVGIAVAAGHLVGAALRSRKPFSALGFAIAFTMASLQTVYTSVRKQADVTAIATSAIEVKNNARELKEGDLARARLRYEQASEKAEREMTGQQCLARCMDWKTLAADVAARIEKLETDLRTMDPPRPVAVGTAKMATVIAMVTAQDQQPVKAMLLLLEPFANALLFELTAIVAFGYGFGHQDAIQLKPQEPATEPSTQSAPPIAEETVADWVREFRWRQKRDPKIIELQARFPGTPKTTAWRRCKAA